ncbi:hypothetical protein [Aliihoeflea sp. PC F10.4]
MIIVRVIRGVTDHFPIRVTEWIMLWPSFLLWASLVGTPDMFDVSPSYAYLAYWADEAVWAMLIGLCAVVRMLALTINGTFKGFAFSPHIRATASIISVIVWSQVSLGFLMAWLNVGGAPSGVVAWSTMVLVEVVNTYRSWADVGKNAAERA